jgi:hypothetical protein
MSQGKIHFWTQIIKISNIENSFLQVSARPGATLLEYTAVIIVFRKQALCAYALQARPVRHLAGGSGPGRKFARRWAGGFAS